MEQIRGRILCEGVRVSRAVRSFIEKQVRHWLLRNGGTGAAGAEPPSFDVTLSREGEGNLVACRVEIRSGARAWIRSQYGAGLQQALQRCLA
ncbi:MAG: hypothetical protein NDJ90_13265 [Oligoflexia bacterium]|nr:hypothetical protein [Oligoflexia bacterium]